MNATFDKDGKLVSITHNISNKFVRIESLDNSDETTVEITQEQADSLLKKKDPKLSDLI